jgi:hypothetical protein
MGMPKGTLSIEANAVPGKFLAVEKKGDKRKKHIRGVLQKIAVDDENEDNLIANDDKINFAKGDFSKKLAGFNQKL